MALDEELQKKIENISVNRGGPGFKLGMCARCLDYGRLFKVPWEDPYAGETGWGWLCQNCVEKSQSVRKLSRKYGLVRNFRIGIGKDPHPVPKPKKAQKSGKAGRLEKKTK